MAASLSTAAVEAQATLTSDLPDYQPGDTAYLTGAGFAAGESVVLLVVHADGTPNSGADHDPWSVVADGNGGFVTTWHVCEDDCIGQLLLATADGQSSGLHAETTFTDAPCAQFGTGVVSSVVGNDASSCVVFSPGGIDNYDVVQGGNYTMTITGVTECSGNAITVFVQGSSTGNFCFNAYGGSGTYIGTFDMPDPACFTYPISYKCGEDAPCNNQNTFQARGPSSIPTNCRQVHLRSSIFNGSCQKIGNDENCQPDCCTPAISCPPDAMVDCSASTAPLATGTASVTNGCAATVRYEDRVESGGCAGTYTILRTWTATGTDSCHYTASCVQRISVTDTTGPEIACPSDASVDCSADTSPAALGSATATDDCSGVASISSSDSVTAGNCAGSYVITRTWTATDGCGNSSSCAQTITVTDTTGPEISCPANASVDCSADTSPAALGSATATDDCSGVDSISSSDSVTAGNCAGNYVITRTWTATDGCGNSSICEQTITVTDTTAPTITCPDAVVMPGNGECCVTVDIGMASASDDCSGATVGNDAPVEFCVGDTTVTWTATDDCGNSSSCTQTVTVLGQICATKFYDANGNGMQDGDEAGIAGWRIDVTGTVDASGFTGPDGTVCFDVPAGNYTVSEGTPLESNWVASTPTSCSVTIDASQCSTTCTFGNYCTEAPSGGFTLGFWSNKNGQAILKANDPAWRTLLNGLGLRKANGMPYMVSLSDPFGTAYQNFRAWLLSATATNMAYMLSAQLAATTLDVVYGGLDDAQGILVPGGMTTGAGVCVVPFLSVSQPISCGAPPLLALTAVPGSNACGCSSNDGLTTIGDVRNRAMCLLAAYGNTTAASVQRTYQECVKNLLDLLNNNGSPIYPCGGLTFINESGDSCPATF
ncbi:MAG TPA: HYR domain-containing protein [Planctomycetota bacterium]